MITSVVKPKICSALDMSIYPINEVIVVNIKVVTSASKSFQLIYLSMNTSDD